MNSSALWGVAVLLFFASCTSNAEIGGASGGRGGPFLQFHTASLSNFDGELQGNPIVIGGLGMGNLSKNFRLGGAGGGGFVWNPSQNMQFGMGYGGIIGELLISSWFNARLLIGGGGYSVAKVTSESDVVRVLDKVASGGFLLFHPSLNADMALSNMLRLSLGVGYFLPNVAQLQSLTITVGLAFAR